MNNVNITKNLNHSILTESNLNTDLSDQFIARIRHKKPVPWTLPYSVQTLAGTNLTQDSGAPYTNYRDGMKPVSLERLQATLLATITYQKAKIGMYNGGYCDRMTAFLSNELNRLNIPYKVVRLVTPDYGALHSSLRVFTKDRDGISKWLIVDPTLGQWFNKGTVNRDGIFIKQEAIFSRRQSVIAAQCPIFIGTHLELQKAVYKNITKLNKDYYDSFTSADMYNEPNLRPIYQNSHYSQEGQLAAALVRYYYKSADFYDGPVYNKNWKPKNKEYNKMANDEIMEYYRHSPELNKNRLKL